MNVVQAAPASPYPFQVEQPDGSSFEAIARGDEFQGWVETADGYTIIKNSTTGFFEYAAEGAQKELAPSGMTVSAAGMSQLAARGAVPAKGLRPPRNAALEQYQGEFLDSFAARRGISDSKVTPAVTGIWAPTPVSGAKKILLILVNFRDATLSAGASTHWNNAVFNLAASSVAKYYQDVSFGAVTISPVANTQPGSPAGVVTVSLAQNHPNSGKNYDYASEIAWINSALAAADPYVDFVALDTNGNGTISVDETFVYFVLAGYEASGSASTPSIWAHAWGGSGVSVSGKNIDHWALNGEKLTSSLMQMGVIAHEGGHGLVGLPDVYDIAGKNEGLGIFSLMASGSWGYKSGELGGQTPTGLDAWSRQYLGWSTPQYPANGSTISFVSGLSTPSAPIMLMNPATSTSEYWLVENRPPVSWDAGMYPYLGSWTGGLLIQHIDLNVGSKSQNSFNKYVAGAHQGNLAEEPSTAACSLKVVTTPSSASRGCPTILYYSGNSTSFNGGSTPNSNFYSGAASSLGITGISTPGSTMTGIVQTVVSGATTYTLSVNSTGASGVVIGASPTTYAGTTNYSKTGIAGGTAITLTAPSSAGGATFANWTGCTSGLGVTCYVTVNASTSVTANYSAPSTYTLSVNSTGATGVAIGASPTTYIGTTNYTKTGIAGGTALTLTAPSSAGGATFANWSGCTTPSGVTCYVTVNASTSVTANYTAPSTYTLSVNSTGATGVAISASPTTYAGTTNYTKTGIAGGTSLTLTAPSSAGGARFANWSGCTTASGVTCYVTVNASTTVTANYSSGVASNILLNPGFESGAANWIQRSLLAGFDLITNSTNFPAHSGAYYAWLGGYFSGTDTLEQSVTIPANATSASLDFWYRIGTEEDPTDAYDILDVELYSAAGARLATLKTLSNLNSTAGAWVKSPAFNLLAYKGQTVRLRFTATTDENLHTSFLIDDVSLMTTQASRSKSLTPILMLLLD
jgi:M6 family metalloprotease-like protein